VPAPFVPACVDYLVFVLAEFDERDQRLLDRVRAPGAGHEPAGLEQTLAEPGRGREALALLEAAVGSGGAAARWRAFADYFNDMWSTRRARLDAQLAVSTRSADWRAVSGIDADSILEERRRYAAVRAALPAALTLGADAPPGT
jgi:hypothetical protein